MGKNPRAYKSEKRNREVAQQQKREAKRLERLASRAKGEAGEEADAAAVVDGIEPVVAESPDRKPDEP